MSHFNSKAIVALTIFLVSCGQAGTDEATRFRPVTSNGEATFANLAEVVFKPHGCFKCHADEDLASEESFVGSDWVSRGDADHSLIVDEVSSGEMPRPGAGFARLNSSEIQLIKDYINALPTSGGSPNETPPPSPPPVPAPNEGFSFASLSQDIFTPHGCIHCHGTEELANERSLRASGWVDRSQLDHSKILREVVSGGMPRGNRYAKLNASEIDELRNYLGTLNP